MHLVSRETHLKRNKTCLTRNEERGGNLLLSGTVSTSISFKDHKKLPEPVGRVQFVVPLSPWLYCIFRILQCTHFAMTSLVIFAELCTLLYYEVFALKCW